MSRLEWRRAAQLTSISDQVLAILRDAGASMTATEIGRQLPSINCWVCSHDRGSCVADPSTPRSQAFWTLPAYRPLMAVHLGSEDAVVQAKPVLGVWVTPALESMARRGLVERSKVGRRVHWSPTGPAMEMAAFEALLEACR